jgi:hypothetical protein
MAVPAPRKQGSSNALRTTMHRRASWKQAGNAVIATQRLSAALAGGDGDGERSSSPEREGVGNPLAGAELQTDC